MAETPFRASASVPAAEGAVGRDRLDPLLGLRLDARSGLVALGAWSLLGVGCAGLGERAPGDAAQPDSREVTRETASEPVRSDSKPNPRSAPPRVVFSDEPDPALEPTDTGTSATSAQELSGAGLVDALAQSYEADRAALAAMRSRKDAAAPATQGGTTSIEFEGAAAKSETRAVETPASPAPSTVPPPQPAAASAASSPAQAPASAPAPASSGSDAPTAPASAAPSAANTAAPTAGSGAEAPTTPAAAAPTPAVTAASSGATPAVAPAAEPGAIQANAALELPPAVPTDPVELTRLLAESLIRASGESETPMAQWLAFAALAVANPDLALPADFGSDLLEAERARVRKAHASFAALGRSLRDGASGFDKSAQEDLLAALSVGPKLTIPKVDLCTRVEAFGRYSAIQNRRFLAGSSPRFIVYSEVDGFTSELEEGRFVTRLATRVSIETERDGVEVWRRSPEWTASSDRSETRRGEFFLCEIVALSEHLSVGGYRLKVEIRDEATGEVAVHALPFHVVADPTMVSVGD